MHRERDSHQTGIYPFGLAGVREEVNHLIAEGHIRHVAGGGHAAAVDLDEQGPPGLDFD
jgi:hypothetical protein